MKRLLFVSACALGGLLATSQSQAGFSAFVIRESAGNVAPDITPLGPDLYEIGIFASSQKAALGSNDINGLTIGSDYVISIQRSDDHTRFALGSGPMFAPYLNLWITDGLGNYAVVANEPTDANFQPLYNDGYTLTFSDLSTKVAKIYENNDKSWLPNNGVGLTFADLAGFIIQAPTVAELALGWAGLGSGAPRELGTNAAYGVNWVFGDSTANYLSGEDGYIVGYASASAVPEPSSLAIFGMGLVGVALRCRQRKSRAANVRTSV